MEQIKILFFVIGTFFGVEQSRIVAEKTTVTVNPASKTITVLQENLMGIIQAESDSLEIQKELKQLISPNQPWSAEFENYTKKEKLFFSSEDDHTLNSTLTLTYSDAKDLKVFGIEVNKEGLFSMTNFPKSHIKSTDGTLGERYWTFKADQPFSFTEAPLTDMPEAYEKLLKGLLPFWKALKP
ncbi:MAG: hypothetical protein AB8B52_13555 [Winogradskyella sp.]|uniref:hypothetical protein n=1 Tax=Winogradskyella sp. TaxID=1883156 RepID=UPI00385C1A7A